MIKLDKKTPKTEEKEGIKPLRLKQVTTVRGKLAKLLKGIGIISGVGMVGGFIGGQSARGAFRDITNYDPDWKEKIESGEISIRGNTDEKESSEKKETPKEVEEETNGILGKIGEVLGKAKNFSEEALKKLLDESMNKIMNKYKSAEKDMLKKYYAALGKVDDKVLWVSFWTSFSITIILALGAIKLKKMALNENNPELEALEKNMLTMQAKINEMRELMMEMMKMQFILPKDQLELMEEAKVIMADFKSNQQAFSKIDD